MVVAAALLGACGDDPAVDTSAQPAPTTAPTPSTSTTAPARPYTADLTTSDGYRYTITMLVGARTPPGGAPDECPNPATPGKTSFPVTLTVANQAADRPAPWPPLRIELATAPGTRPGQVMLKDTSGTCTFTPRVPSIGPGASVTFKGTTPAIDDTAAPGTAGRLEVKASETTFSLTAPLP